MFGKLSHHDADADAEECGKNCRGPGQSSVEYTDRTYNPVWGRRTGLDISCRKPRAEMLLQELESDSLPKNPLGQWAAQTAWAGKQGRPQAGNFSPAIQSL